MNAPDKKEIEQLSPSKKRGCPTCSGIDPKSCMRCYGKTRMSDWYYLDGWSHLPVRTRAVK